MKTILLNLIFLFCLATSFAQTNVSGGIYANTTWTLANSPYIVVDTIVVFPGNTLTIEPGVVVKFEDNVIIELRQAGFSALGTSTDSITFTSNSNSPHAGIYKGLYFNDPTGISFDYCVFKFASKAVYVKPWITFPLNISHSTFTNNSECITETVYGTTISQCAFVDNIAAMDWSGGICNLDSCYFENNQVANRGGGGRKSNCTFIDNQIGLDIMEPGPTFVIDCSFCHNVTACMIGDDPGANYSYPDTVRGNTFVNNHKAFSGQFTIMTENTFFENDTALSDISLHDSIDIWQTTRSHMFNNNVFNNHVGLIYYRGTSPLQNTNNICHNTVYNVVYSASTNGIFPDQCYCTTDSAQIAASVYDGYDDITLGLLTFTPFANCNDSVLPVDTFYSCQSILNGIESVRNSDELFLLYPNPTSNTFTIRNLSPGKSELLRIFNTLGEILYSEKLSGRDEYLVDARLAKGIYFVSITDGEKIGVRKLIVD